MFAKIPKFITALKDKSVISLARFLRQAKI